MHDVTECRKNCNTGRFTTAASTGNLTEILPTCCFPYLDNKLNINRLSTEFVTRQHSQQPKTEPERLKRDLKET